MIEHFERMMARLGERLACVEFRKRMSWYAKTIGPCPKLRRQVPLIKTAVEFHALVAEFLEEIGGGPGADLRHRNCPSIVDRRNRELVS